jgi:alpha-D-ribose 1-methylphosphonate 5-triphosphate synthase subunit PhnI
MYTTVRDDEGAIEAATRLLNARGRHGGADTDSLADRLPLLVDQVMAEAGVVEPAVAARAVDQALGDLSRAVSLLRAWSACLPRLGTSTASVDELDWDRRITSAFHQPEGGQYLGASADFAPRLLNLTDLPPTDDASDTSADSAPDGPGTVPSPVDSEAVPLRLPRAAERLESDFLLDPGPTADPVDRTRVPAGAGAGRGPLQQFLAQAETGALTALAYSASVGSDGHPIILDLRAGRLPVRVPHPDTGGVVEIGSIRLTTCETASYRITVDDSGEHIDPRLTLGVGATVGDLERRAISAAILDARLSRAGMEGAPAERSPADDEEWLLTALDGQEATGFVEHLKLPHHVSFTADLDRITDIARGRAEEEAR